MLAFVGFQFLILLTNHRFSVFGMLNKVISSFFSFIFLKVADCVLNIVCHINGKTPLEVSPTSDNNVCNNNNNNLKVY